MLDHIEELGGSRKRLKIALDEADVQGKIEELYGEYGRKAQIPGFRKGKVPRSILERKYGESIRAEAIEALRRTAYVEAVKEAGLKPIWDPEFDDVDASATDGKHYFTATVEVRPEVVLEDYEGLEFTERVQVVTNDDVEHALEHLRERQAELIQVTRPSQEGDVVVIDSQQLGADGTAVSESKVEDYVCEIGHGVLVPDFEHALAGVTTGDAKTVTVTYPEDWGEKTLAGKRVSYDVTIKDVREKRLPAVDDAFASAVGGFETLLDLRVRLRDRLEGEAKAVARRRLEEEIVRELIKRNRIDLPERLVEHRLQRMYESAVKGRGDDAPAVDPEEFRRVYRAVVEHQLKAGLLLGAIADKHEIRVSKEDVEGRITQLAEQQGREPAQLIEDLKGTDALSNIEDDIWLEKVHNLIVGISKVTTETFEPSEVSRSAEAQGDEGQQRA